MSLENLIITLASLRFIVISKATILSSNR